MGVPEEARGHLLCVRLDQCFAVERSPGMVEVDGIFEALVLYVHSIQIAQRYLTFQHGELICTEALDCSVVRAAHLVRV